MRIVKSASQFGDKRQRSPFTYACGDIVRHMVIWLMKFQLYHGDFCDIILNKRLYIFQDECYPAHLFLKRDMLR